jgi:hypothetical protein
VLAFANAAYRELQDRLAGAGITVNRAVATLTNIPANTKVLSLSSSPALPADFVLPYGLEERPNGSTQKFVPMEESDTVPLPDVDSDSTLKLWGYYQNQINLLGATSATDVRLDYEQRVSPFSAGTDAVAIIGAVNFLAYRSGSMIALSRGDSAKATYYAQMAEAEALKYLRTHVQAQQFKAGRRIPFGYKRVSWS